MTWFSKFKLRLTISTEARSVSVTREKNFNFASLHILPLACCNHPPFSLTNVKCSKCQSEYWMHIAQQSVALKMSLVTIVKNITSVQQYRGGRSRPTMIMAILPTVLPPITASFYFAATNLPNNCWRQKNVPRSGLYGDRDRESCWLKVANLQIWWNQASTQGQIWRLPCWGNGQNPGILSGPISLHLRWGVLKTHSIFEL